MSPVLGIKRTRSQRNAAADSSPSSDTQQHKETEKDILAVVPFEIWCKIFTAGVLTMRDIVRFSRTSRACHRICSNENLLQRAAYKWGYVQNLTDSLPNHINSLKDEQAFFKSNGYSWKRYCIARHCLEEQFSFMNSADSDSGTQVHYPKVSYDFVSRDVLQNVQDIRVDYEEQTLIWMGISTRGEGSGLRVSDLTTTKLLWHTDVPSRQAYITLAADSGYIICARPPMIPVGDLPERFLIYKSERLCKKRVLPSRRGHYHLDSTLEFPVYTSFQFKFPFMAIATLGDEEVTFWDVEKKKEGPTLNVGKCRTDVQSLDFNEQFLFIAGKGAQEVFAIERKSGMCLWHVKDGVAPMVLGVHPDENAHVKLTSYPPTNSAAWDGKVGGAHRPELVQRSDNPFSPMAIPPPWHPLLSRPDIAGSFSSWDSIRICEETNTLVVSGRARLVILRDYKVFLQDQTKRPELFVVIRAPAFSVADRPSALSVCNGRALWLSTGQYIVDWRKAKSAEDIKLTQLTEYYSATQIDEEQLDANLDDWEAHKDRLDSVDALLLKQMGHTNYIHRMPASPRAVLTPTAAYSVELQSVRASTCDPSTSVQLKGCSSNSAWGEYFITAVRCWDFARSALYEFDRDECCRQVDRFLRKRFPKISATLDGLPDDEIMEFLYDDIPGVDAEALDVDPEHLLAVQFMWSSTIGAGMDQILARRLRRRR